MTTALFAIPDILACRFERRNLNLVELSHRLGDLLADVMETNPQGATVLDIIQAQDLPKLESVLSGEQTTVTCALNEPDSTRVQFRFHLDPLNPSEFGLLLGEVVEDLEGEVLALQKALNQAKSDRERLVSLNGLLVHDLRNSLQVLISHTDLARRSSELGHSQDIDRRLDILAASGKDMAHRLDELNKYLRLELGDYPREITDLNELVDGCTRRAHKQSSRPLKITQSSDFPTLLCERQLVDELFSNLIGNAIRYSKTDPVCIEIGLLEPRTSQPVFFVRDSGVGIHPDDLPHVFTPLRRSDRQKLNTHGSGMGLAYVKQIVERHQGEIWLESAVSHGTTVHFSLGPRDPG